MTKTKTINSYSTHNVDYAIRYDTTKKSGKWQAFQEILSRPFLLGSRAPPVIPPRVSPIRGRCPPHKAVRRPPPGLAASICELSGLEASRIFRVRRDDDCQAADGANRHARNPRPVATRPKIKPHSTAGESRTVLSRCERQGDVSLASSAGCEPAPSVMTSR